MHLPASPMHRLLVALLPDAPVQVALRAQGRAWYWPASSWQTRPQRLHMTLHFMGDLCLQDEQRLRDSLPTVPMEPLDLVLDTAQAWPNGIAVLLPRVHPGLKALHQRIGEALANAGLRPMRHWAPHVTLARHAANAFPPEASAPIHWPVREFVLLWSVLSPVARYQVLGRYGVQTGCRGTWESGAGEGNRTLV